MPENSGLPQSFRYQLLSITSEQVAEWRRIVNRGDAHLPQEITNGRVYQEGSVQQVLVNRYERDPRARRECIERHGTECCICKFNFGARYGPTMEGFIHVHHLTPLHEIKAEYAVNPITDLRPVCPNCHAVLHHGGQSRKLEEVQQLLR